MTERIHAPKEELKWYYSGIAESLNLHGCKMFDEYKAYVEKVFD